MIWRIILIGLYVFNLGISLSEHGKPKTGTNSFWLELIGTAIQIVLMALGGFFK